MSFHVKAFRYQVEPLESRLLLSVDPQLTTTVAPGAFAGMPAVFVPNHGQWDQAIRYAAHGSGADILFTDTGPTFRIIDRPDTPPPSRRQGQFTDPVLNERNESLSTNAPVTVNEWSLTFVDAARVAPIGLDQQQTVFNYYLGDPSAWRAGVSSFGGVVYRDLWTGIDAHVMARDGGMKYEFHLAPGADPQDIALRYKDVQGLSLSKGGGLSIHTPARTITDDAPIAWQTHRDGTRVEVSAKFVLLDQFTYTISPTGAFDPTLPLVLDPQLLFGSYLGGASVDRADEIASDGSGGAWVTGYTSSADFPTPGGFDTIINGGDAFVARITASGALAFASYLGGVSEDSGSGIASDGAGGAWVTGETFSTNFPAPGGFDQTLSGDFDGFVAHVNANGALTFGSYLGGVDRDRGRDIDTDGAEGVWVTGFTRSPDFPTPGGFDTTFTALTDGFVARITAGGTLAYGSFLGASQGLATATDGAGGAFVTGNNFGGAGDVYVAHVTAGGSLGFAINLGGNANEIGWGIASDAAGGAWVTGWTASANFPTPGGFDTTRGGSTDAFIARITAAGTVAFGSYLGGSNVDQSSGLTPDGAGGVWMTGDSDSADFPTPGGFDTTYNGNRDAFVARVTAGGTLAFGSYLGGGSGRDSGSDIAPDGTGGVWVAGETESTDFPAPGGFDTTLNGRDGFIVRISEDTTAPSVTDSQFAYEFTPQSIRITFSENVSASLSLDDLTLENLTTTETIPSANLALSYNTATNVATITFPGYPYGALPNGTYRATLLAAGVTDAAGNPLAANHVLNFFFKQGDADHNNVINFDDYARIDNGFNNRLIGWDNGDFNYDGVINFDDYAIIDLAFNTQ